MLATSLVHDGPTAFRYPRGPGVGVPLAEPEILEIGKGRVVFPGGPQPEVLILGYGSMVHPSIEAAKKLQAEGIRAVVVDPRFVKPLDEELICDLASQTGRVVTAEEGCLPGGFGSAVVELLQERGIHVPVKRIGLPDHFVTHGSADLQKASFGLDAEGIAAASRSLVGLRAGVQAG